jgi:hypothetical protein
MDVGSLSGARSLLESRYTLTISYQSLFFQRLNLPADSRLRDALPPGLDTKLKWKEQKVDEGDLGLKHPPHPLTLSRGERGFFF